MCGFFSASPCPSLQGRGSCAHTHRAGSVTHVSDLSALYGRPNESQTFAGNLARRFAGAHGVPRPSAAGRRFVAARLRDSGLGAYSRAVMKAALMLVAGLALAVVLAGCERDDVGGVVEPPAASGPNVLLVTLDTTRADRLGCYGHEASGTPYLDDLASRGVRFERAYAQVPLTLPSHASLLTGEYPPEIGLRVNGSGRLGGDVPTLASVLKGRGYRTGAFVAAAVLSDAYGLDRGFDHYDNDLGADTGGGDAVAERPGDAVCDAAIAWLDASSDRPFFAWVHLFDPHHPYEPPEPYQENFADPYDGEIAFADAQVGRLLEWLSDHGLQEETLVVVAGDHGEAFGEHEEKQHGLFVYEATMHVPLIMALPSAVPAGGVVGDVAELVDVMPTVLELVGAEDVPEISGRSLVAAMRDSESEESQYAYGESQYARMSFGWAPLASLTSERWKYIRAPRPELYDLQVDPGEAANVIAEHADVAADLGGRLDRMLGAMELREASSAELDAEALAQLQSLGYLGGTAASAGDEPADGRDPKDMVGVYRGMMRARDALQRGRFADVVAILEPLIEQSPESDALYAPLGAAYLRLGRFEEAQQAYAMSLRQDPDHPGNLCGLGDALRQLGGVEEAVTVYERVLASWPEYGQAHSRLGLIRARQGNHAKALEHFRRFAELSPSSPNAHANLANALMAGQKVEEAVQELETALELSPEYEPALRVYWNYLWAAGRHKEAVAALRQACDAFPQDGMLWAKLAWVLATSPGLGGGPEEAVQIGERAAGLQPDDPMVLDVLGMAYARAARFEDAARVAERAVELARAAGNDDFAGEIQYRLQRYREGRPMP